MEEEVALTSTTLDWVFGSPSASVLQQMPGRPVHGEL